MINCDDITDGNARPLRPSRIERLDHCPLLKSLLIGALLLITACLAPTGESELQPGTSEAVTRLSPGTQVRILASDGKVTRGPFVSASESTVVIGAGKRRQTIAKKSILKLEAKTKGGRLAGAVAGSAGGILSILTVPAGLIIGSSAGSATSGGEWRSIYAPGVVVFSQ